MDIKFQGTIQVIEDTNTSIYFLPEKGTYFGKTGINESDFCRKIVIPHGQSTSITLGYSDSFNMLCIVTDNDINLTAGTINSFLIKAGKISEEDKSYGIFITTCDNITLPISINNPSSTDPANVDIYLTGYKTP